LYVCICRAVTEAEVRGCIADGACTVEDVMAHCAAGTGCGSCVEKITAQLGARADQGVPALPSSTLTASRLGITP
jgi:bacterioferritin-associated ferredoxin